MILPYSKKTYSSGGGFFSSSPNPGESLIDSGLEIGPAYITLAGFILIILLVHIKQNLATAILSLIA